MTSSSTLQDINDPPRRAGLLGYGGVTIERYGLQPVDKDSLPSLWPKIQHDFELTILDINDQDYNGDSVYGNVESGVFSLFSVIDVDRSEVCGFITVVIEGCTTQLHDGAFTRKWITVNHGFLYRSTPLNQTMLNDGLRQIEAAGKEQGCGSIRIKGRLGWSKWLRKMGYNTHMVLMDKPIES